LILQSLFSLAACVTGVPSGLASRLRTVIDKIDPENGGITPWEDQVSICGPWRNGGQENMIVDT